MGEFCHAFFYGIFGNGQLSMLIYCQKNQQVTFKVTFIANRQLSALKSP
jgi:hypothetical protein